MTEKLDQARHEAVNSLERAVRDRFPAATLERTLFESGAFMLDVRLGQRLFVVAFSPASGFGVDEAYGDDGIDSSYRYAATGVDEVIRRLEELVARPPDLSPP